MPLQPVPPLAVQLSIDQVHQLDNEIVSSIIETSRACANCGQVAFGLEPAVNQYRTCNRKPGINDRAQQLSPLTQEFSTAPTIQTHPDRVYCCRSCTDARRCFMSEFVPTATQQYCTALVSVPFSALHSTSFINVSYKLTTEAFGYVTGQFSQHSLVQSPLLYAHDEPDHNTFGASLQFIKDELTSSNSLYQHYMPLWELNGHNLHCLPARTFQHILHAAQGRDPVTDRHEHHNRAPAILDVVCNTDARHTNISTASLGLVQPVVAAPGQSVHALMSQADLLYKTGRTAILEDGQPVEQMLMPAFFPRQDGSYQLRRGFTPLNYLRMRCRQAFTAFTVQSAYLLLLRAMENARACIENAFGAYVVNKQAFDSTQQTMRASGLDPTTTEVLDRLVKKKVSDSVDGSPRFFKREKLELDAMTRHLGLPTHFITITMNETGDHRAPEYVALDQIIKQWDALLSWQNLPVECNRAFLMRFNHVWDRYIMGGPKILGPVQDFAIRFECQGRGSLHAHICIWLPQDQATALDHRIISFIPADFDTDTGHFVAPQDPLMQRLYMHAQHKQQHACRISNERRKGCVCDGHCKLGFPQPLHEGTEPTLREQKRRYKYRCPRPCDQHTVSWLPELGLLFDAHVNIVKIVDEEWSSYILKYSAKPPPSGDLDLRQEDILALGLPSADIWTAAVAHRFAVTSVYQPAQLALLAQDVPVFKKSRTVPFINIDPPELRSKRVQVHFQGPMRPDDQVAYTERPTNYALTDPATGVVQDFSTMRCVHFHRRVVLYSKRQLQDITSVNQSQWVKARQAWNSPEGAQNRTALSPAAAIDMPDRFIGVSPNNLAYFWRDSRHIVRFPWCDPRKNFDAFCYHLLCEHLHFESETFFTSEHGSYAAAAIHYSIIDTFDKLYAHMASHCKYVFASATLTDDDIHTVYSTLFTNIERVHAGPDVRFELNIARATDIMNDVSQRLPPNLQLDPSQIAAYQAVINPNSRGLFVIRGGPGAGKSVVARLIARDRALSDGVILMAPTNEVARRFSSFSDTIHATAQIPLGRTFPGLRSTHTHIRTMATCHTIIIDEAFMVTAQTFQFLLSRLTDAQHLGLDLLLQRNTIVLVGDERQLPPPCTAMCRYLADVCTTHHIANNLYFRNAFNDDARSFYLATNHRNPDMALKLAHIANQHRAPLTQEWVDEHINMPYCRITPLDVNSRTLTSHHEDAFSHNAQALIAFSHDQGVDLVDLPRAIFRQAQALGAGLLPVTYDELNHAERCYVDRHAPSRMPNICVHAPVRFFTSVDKQSGQTTAATGTVVGFNTSAQGLITGIRVLLDRNHRVVSVNRKTVTHCPPGGAFIRASFWPLAPAFASTVHSMQGANVDSRVDLNLRSCFDPGLTYTALSRNTTNGCLTLTKPLTVHDLRVIDLRVYYAALSAYNSGAGPAPHRRERT